MHAPNLNRIISFVVAIASLASTAGCATVGVQSNLDDTKAQMSQQLTNYRTYGSKLTCLLPLHYGGANVPYVTKVKPSAQEAGLRPGDRITHINNVKINSFQDELKGFGSAQAGDTVEIQVLRNGQTVVANLTCLPRDRLNDAIVEMLSAGARGDWDACMANAQKAIGIRGTSSFYAFAFLNCSEAKRLSKGHSPNWQDASVAYEARRYAIDEWKNVPGGLDEIRSDVIGATEWLRQNNFRRFASDLDQYFRDAKQERVVRAPDNQGSKLPPKSQESSASGTCFFVSSDGTAVTNAHVVRGGDAIEIVYGHETFNAQLVALNQSNDLAILTSEARPNGFLALAPSNSAKVGERVFTIGYPATDILGAEPKYTDGTISALSGIGGDTSWMQITVPIQPGNSGGPLVSEEGLVVGVVVATAQAAAFMNATGSLPQNVNWAIKAEYLRPMLETQAIRSESRMSPHREAAIQAAKASLCRIIVR